MNLRLQILGLLCLPIICQLATVSLLYTSLTTVEKNARQEIRAKQIIAQLQECDGLLGRSLVRLTDVQFFNKVKDVQQDTYLKNIEQKNNELVRLVKDNQTALRVAQSYRRHAKELVQNWMDLTNSHTPGFDKLFFSQFLNTAEYLENMKVLSDQLYKETQELLAIYRPMVKELQPRSVEERDRLRLMIIVAIVFNIILIAALALIVNTKTLRRLSSLLSHIRAFAKGGRTKEALVGSDELAELDRAFTAVANERHNLDQLRQSIREMVNHDLRSPLTSMCLRIDSIMEMHHADLTPPVRQHLTHLGSETQRLHRLANTLLDIDRLEDGKLEVELRPVLAERIIGTSQSIVEAQATRKSIKISAIIVDRLVVLCDEDRTVQVLTNLLSNAVKFAPRNSEIKIKAINIESDSVRISVLDQGSGVPPQEVENLFKRFTQLDQPEDIKKTGSGLGLFICKSLIEAQGGSIGYTAPDEPGGCFWIELKAYPQDDSNDSD